MVFELWFSRAEPTARSWIACVASVRGRGSPTVQRSAETWRHAQALPHAPSPLPVPRLPISGKPSNQGHRAPRLHEEPARLARPAPVPHLQPHVLQSSSNHVLVTAALTADPPAVGQSSFRVDGRLR